MLDVNPELDFEGFEPQDFHSLLQANGEWAVMVEDVENDATLGIKRSLLARLPTLSKRNVHRQTTAAVVSQRRRWTPKMSRVRKSIDTLLQYADVTENRQIRVYSHHLQILKPL